MFTPPKHLSITPSPPLKFKFLEITLLEDLPMPGNCKPHTRANGIVIEPYMHACMEHLNFYIACK